MAHETDIDYHVRRHRDELKLAYHSDCPRAAKAHLQLSAMHMERVRQGVFGRAVDRAVSTLSQTASGSLYAKFAAGTGWPGSKAEPLRPGGEAMRVPSLPQPF